jgi:enoyl-CoA hydratase/carnithine racemase
MSETSSRAGTSWRCDRTGGDVWTLWFDSPGRSHNVLDQAAFEELDHRLDEVEADGSARGLLLRSGKESGFCAGADLKTIHWAASERDLLPYFRRGLEVIERLAALKVPTTAVVHGVCLGGGLELALACRCRVALASAEPLQIGCPEVQLGLIPAWGAIVRLTRVISARDALGLLISGNPLGFLQAKSQGLVHRLVTQDEQERITETLGREPCPEAPLAGGHWEGELKFALARMADQPSDFPEAQEAILDVVRADLSGGPEAARSLAIERCVALALEDSTRAAIADFFDRRQRGS